MYSVNISVRPPYGEDRKVLNFYREFDTATELDDFLRSGSLGDQVSFMCCYRIPVKVHVRVVCGDEVKNFEFFEDLPHV